MSSLIKEGDTVSVHYTGKYTESGEQFDSSHDAGSPLQVIVGSGQLIPGFEAALVGMQTGESKSVDVAPDQGYGQYNPEAVVALPKDTFPAEIQENLQVGMVLPLVLKQNPEQPFPAKATEIGAQTITFDLNHPLAGKDISFDIEVVSVETDETDTETEE